MGTPRDIIGISQLLRQRIATYQAVAQHRLGSLCARELETRFGVEQYWPQINAVSGELRQGPATCYWKLTLGNTGVNRLRRGELSLFADPQQRQPLGQFSLFLVRP